MTSSPAASQFRNDSGQNKLLLYTQLYKHYISYTVELGKLWSASSLTPTLSLMDATLQLHNEIKKNKYWHKKNNGRPSHIFPKAHLLLIYQFIWKSSASQRMATRNAAQLWLFDVVIAAAAAADASFSIAIQLN